MGDVTKILRDWGIPITYNNGDCRSLRDILEDLNGCWDKLNEQQKIDLCYIIKGENRNE